MLSRSAVCVLHHRCVSSAGPSSSSALPMLTSTQQQPRHHYSSLWSDNALSDAICTGIQLAHDATGVPWGACLMLTALGVRALTLPTTVAAEYLRCKRFHVERLTMQHVRGTIEGRFGAHSISNVMNSVEFQKQWSRLVSRQATANKCTLPRVLCTSFLSLPVWVCTSLAVRNLTGANFMREAAAASPGFRLDVGEPWLWLPSLLQPDPLAIAPVTATAAMLYLLLMMQARVPAGMPLGTRIQLYVRQTSWSIIIVYLGYILATAQLPSGVALFWATSSVSTVFIQLCLMHPSVKRVIGLPGLPTDTRQPFRDSLRNTFGRLLPKKAKTTSTAANQPTVSSTPISSARSKHITRRF